MYAVETIVDLIPVGRANAISRQLLTEKCLAYGLIEPYQTSGDRAMRRLIEKAREEHVIINLQDGNGYFIPDKDDIDSVQTYINQSRSRYRHITRSMKYAGKLLEDMKAGRLDG
jgi:hypothetical protein